MKLLQAEQYYCVIKSKIITETQYRTCRDCADGKFLEIWGQGCATLNIVGSQNSNDFSNNMQKLIKVKMREKKLNSILK